MRPHELDRVSLVTGLVFLALAVLVAAEAPLLAVLRHTRWLLPAFGILLGLGLLGSALRDSAPGGSRSAVADAAAQAREPSQGGSRSAVADAAAQAREPSVTADGDPPPSA